MVDEPSTIGGAFGGGGSNVDPFGDTTGTASSPVDTRRSAGAVRSILGSITGEATRATRALEGMNRAIERGSTLLRGLRSRRGGGGTTTTSDATADAIERTEGLAAGGGRGGGGRGARLANFMGGKGGFLATTAFQIGQQAVGQLDQRVNRAYEGMLAADRLGVLFQQTQGITQQQYYANYREPLQKFRLGAGGANILLGLEAQTGIRAAGQAGSVQGLSAASGYAYGTQDFAQMIRALANPMVNNRMTMTLGTGIYGPGGSQRSLTQVFQSVVRGAGLTNERLIRSGKQIGSLTRARLSSLGIPEDMQDLVLQYAEENAQFQRKTGGNQGMYDPEQAAHRRLMGIEKNFATQREETTRRAEQREDVFYNRQKDNMAALEKNTQALIGMQQGLEDFMSTVIGKRISYRGGMVARALRGAAGIGMIGGGIALMSSGPLGVLAGAGLITSGFTNVMGTLQGGGPGDPTETGSQYNTKKYVSGGSGKPVSGSKLNNLNQTFRERLEQLIAASGGRISIDGGFRSSAQQATLFKSRYTRTNEKTGIFWNGSYWKNTSGEAPVAPPGMSMHEIGLAADMKGDMQWLQQNAARFGLKTFADVNNEPWHVQPLELPNSRRQYEASGSPWGTIAGAEPFDPDAFFEGSKSPGGVSEALYKSYGGAQVPIYSQMSISDSIQAARAANVIGGGSVAFGRMTSPAGGGGGKGADEIRKRNTLSGNEVAKILFNAGFRGDDLVKALAISHRESGGWNTNAFNPNKDTKDLSYGLFQLNMLGDLGPWRRKFFGIGSNEELFNPITNAQAAFKLYQLRKKEGKDPFYDWGGYKNMSSTYSTDLKNAHSVAKHSGYLSKEGDPTMPARGGGGMVVASGDTITIAPNIYIQSTGSNEADARRAAEEFSRIFNQNIRVAALRKS